MTVPGLKYKNYELNLNGFYGFPFWINGFVREQTMGFCAIPIAKWFYTPYNMHMLSEPCAGSYRERHINSHSNQKYFQLIIDVNL
jgi:hypothetical protein